MKIRSLSRISSEEIKSKADAPSWLPLLLDPLNQFMENIVKALQGKITYVDNVACVVTERIKFVHNVELLVAPQTQKRVITVVPLEIEDGLGYNAFGWRRDADGRIGITIGFVGGGTITKKVILRFETE